MQSKFFHHDNQNICLGQAGASLLLGIGLTELGGAILGLSLAYTSSIGGLILLLPHVGLQWYLEQLENQGKISGKTHTICTNIAITGYILSSAVIGSMIFSQAILPALLASGLGVGILAAIVATVYFGNKGYQYFSKATNP